MKNILSYIVVIILIVSCHEDVGDQAFALVEEYNSKYLEDSINNYPYDYYVGNNVIVPELSNYIYYHDTRLYCGTGWKITNPPRTIDFESDPLYRFESVTEFLEFLDENQKTPRLVMLVSDLDTIRNTIYFALRDTIESLEKTYIISTRRTTPDEESALSNSNFIDIDLNRKCDLEGLRGIQRELNNGGNVKLLIEDFLNHSQINCRYDFEYQTTYEQTLYSIFHRSPEEFSNHCSGINEVQRHNIKFGLENSYLVDDNIVKETHDMINELASTEQWLLTAVKNRRVSSIE